jgi:hypothetical protein
MCEWQAIGLLSKTEESGGRRWWDERTKALKPEVIQNDP